MANDIQGLDRLVRRLAQLATDTRRVEAPLRAAGALVQASVEKNFQEQGRPERWTPLSPKTLSRRRRGRGSGGPRILVDTGRLKNSIAFHVVSEPGVEIGTNVVYARRQHAGYPGIKGGGRGHSKTPSREFLLMQRQDIKDVGDIFKRHLARGKR